MSNIPAVTNDQLWLKAIHAELVEIRKLLAKGQAQTRTQKKKGVK